MNGMESIVSELIRPPACCPRLRSFYRKVRVVRSQEHVTRDYVSRSNCVITMFNELDR